MMMNRTFHQARRIVGVILFLLLVVLPFIRVGGESAFRFDVPTLRLHFFGSAVWMEDFFLILLALIFLTFLIMLVTVLFGRIWCGWLCPQTILVDLAETTGPSAERGGWYLVRAVTVYVVMSALVAASLVGYFVSPYDVPSLLRAGGLASRIMTGSWIVLTIILFLDLLLLGRSFCAAACPYAKMQGVLFDQRTLTIAFDERRKDECMHCDACVRDCPMSIDVRKGPQMACIHCAECVDACTRQTARIGHTSLIGYFFGRPGTSPAQFRLTPLLTGVGTAAALLLLFYIAAASTPFEMTVRQLDASIFSPVRNRTAERQVLLVLRNKKRIELTITLSAASANGKASVRPEQVVVSPSEDGMKVPVVVTLQDIASYGAAKVRLTARSESEPAVVTKEITLITKPSSTRSGP